MSHHLCWSGGNGQMNVENDEHIFYLHNWINSVGLSENKI